MWDPSRHVSGHGLNHGPVSWFVDFLIMLETEEHKGPNPSAQTELFKGGEYLATVTRSLPLQSAPTLRNDLRLPAFLGPFSDVSMLMGLRLSRLILGYCFFRAFGMSGEEEENAAELKIGDEFLKAKCLMNCEVAIILEHKYEQLQQMADDPMNQVSQ
ncbi:hypothetical protein RHMOL_Rhmol02G0091100 [Rhododendron molle]|uniref:Uncharacterized protein n=1 Tax=Rhododendron molle TaxID=49168 RepID=A0ACC0PMV0_RHOML|nr:hypothetical protein RHMOL_Rhmol02G0091100 [Rhododendron molle]